MILWQVETQKWALLRVKVETENSCRDLWLKFYAEPPVVSRLGLQRVRDSPYLPPCLGMVLKAVIAFLYVWDPWRSVSLLPPVQPLPEVF